ncbi:MAG: SDR family oxidoreductase [Clostridiales Family XIII bacterium]|jgi:NAD(P)-dependent dehydrogenase (short-subunit alcohol dehydrogenase family)|nr:SDR family oxidoreductase [Clostridiales Family XIII bacterium]
MYEDLNGKTAIVTGVGSRRGMGFAIATRLSKEGCRLLLADVRALDAIEPLADCIRSAGGIAEAFQCDIADETSVRSMVDHAISSFGQVDILINNAGILRAKAFLDYLPSDWDLMYNVMVKGSFLCTKSVAEKMLEKHIPGAIVNLSSMGGKRVFPGEAAYGTCKRAVLHLTQAAAAELSPLGIRVNGVAPGDHWTDMLEQCFREMAEREGRTVEDLIAESEAETPMRRMGTTEDVANVCAFLASDQSSFVTGQVINVNGGFFME